MHLLLYLKKYFTAVTIIIAYIVIDMILTYKEILWFNLLPVVLLIVYLAIARINIVYFIIVALTPISIELIEYLPSSSFNFSIPTEPMLFGLMLLLFYRSVRAGYYFKHILNHPLTYAVLFNVFWIFLTSITSTMPLVSFKFLLARIWFVSVYYFLAILIFQNKQNIRAFIWCYTLPMLIVIFYSISRHLSYGLFDKQASHFVMEPFFRDHTSYGAVLAMLFFAWGGLTYRNKSAFIFKLLFYSIWIIILSALILSYTRAAWISVMVSLAVIVLTLLKVKFRYLLLIGIAAVVYLTSQRVEIIQKMGKNRQESSATLAEHVQSISNITTDESNMERINRWNAALRMFKEKPVFGWGPGTYMFQYAPFQLARDKTGISTNFGDLGNAHSEYIGPLAESGILGSLSFILIGIISLLTGFRVYTKLENKDLKQLTLGLLLGYITYLVHGTLNNFLDKDKASALFWGFSAIFVALDLSLEKLNAKN